MKRTLMITVSAVALIATAATAQSPMTARGKVESESAAMQAGQNWREMISVPGTVSLMQSEIAVDKASHPKVMEFAKFETSEQNALSTVLKELGTKPPVIPAKDQAMLDKLKNTPKGAEFDKAYVQAQIEGHAKLMAANNSILDSRKSEGSEERHLAMVLKPTITQHIANTTELNKLLK